MRSLVPYIEQPDGKKPHPRSSEARGPVIATWIKWQVPWISLRKTKEHPANVDCTARATPTIPFMGGRGIGKNLRSPTVKAMLSDVIFILEHDSAIPALPKVRAFAHAKSEFWIVV